MTQSLRAALYYSFKTV